MDALLYQLKELFIAKGHCIATAESCTGGLVASLLTEVPGSSQWFDRGFVCYSNLAKQEMLGVDPVLIEQYGAVSQQVAEAMALGALQFSKASLSLSITGIAGPDGGSIDKPVGTVWLGFASKARNIVRTEHCLFSNCSRHQVRARASRKALVGILTLLSVQ
ncbi:Competence-damage inducible protein CinA [Legionella birminghamensis]|uniref:Competence-damage inducible protein CinA n=1 Tax=Legionella birminghamensis TaxID=28083 RepID=A0A378IFY7_9GAMM|nr:CinA family protein [Legionella birminghamensis]KTC68166.1 Competence-damage inducible protein CinA [Legionella birminghamensis]STX31124.1 Competence-damage inducible protein CinA [Legionella birminghamensis]